MIGRSREPPHRVPSDGVTLPEGINPAKMPPREALDALSEDDLFAIIDYWQHQNSVWLGAQFWIDELSRRRTHGVLDRIAAAATAEADRAAEMVRLTAEAAAENARTASLNQEMRDMTRVMMWLTIVSVIISTAALGLSAVALAS